MHPETRGARVALLDPENVNANVTSSFAMEQIKYTTALPINVDD
jgi:hypothetical protein